MNNSTTMYFYRIRDGKKLKYKFTVGQDLVIQSETLVGEEDKEYYVDNSLVKSVNNTKIINSITPEYQEDIKFFSDNYEPPTKELKQLKIEYLEELNKIGGNSCKACDKGRLMRKYIPKIRTFNKK